MSLKERIILPWKRIFGKKESVPYDMEDGIEQVLPAFHREKVNMHNKGEREQYIGNCLQQIADAERELHHLEYEYNMVTSHLTDIEELERSPEEIQFDIRETAEKLNELKETQNGYERKKNRISEEDFSRMEKVEGDVQDGIKKLREAEDYQKLVKSDMRRLNGERHAYEYRRDELERELKNASGIAGICFIALVVCLIVLFVLQVTLRFDTKIGYVLVVFIAAVVILKLFLRHGEAGQEIVRVEKDINRLILLQNTVKIRYVNNKHLLDYLYMKFQVKNASQLQSLRERYEEEKAERERMEKASKDYDYYQKEFLRLLRQARIRDTSVWLHQVGAVLEEQEMTRLRQELVGRRKVLREQMDYNRQLAAAAQTEVTEISGKYPKYREEILELISEYERKQKEAAQRRRR
ncbi:MAG: hypothetical protein HFI07_13585 [Lachnospiraceae bacterium]|jgi:hypothetical protein|nr:hypothetical protein [Lachnospiraceae bacterium]